MTKNFLLSIFLLNALNVCAQKTKTPDCNKLMESGYTAAFCQFDKTYAFKKIPFESNYDYISSQCTLTKDPLSNNQYFVNDDKFINWLGVKFYKCIFSIRKDDKFNGVLLVVKEKESQSGETITIIEKLKTFLTNMYGKPTLGGYNDFAWLGENLSLSLYSDIMEGDVIIKIFITNQ